MNKKITREIILYIVFGGLTTVVNIVAYWLLYYAVCLPNTLSTIIAWLLAVLFAYVTNRIWVFESNNKNKLKEAFDFFFARAMTGAFDLIIMYVFVDLLLCNGMFTKIFSNAIVVVLNYIASKLFVFKKQ